MPEAAPYGLVDEAISAWARTNKLKLFESFDGRQARFCYVSSAEGECVQIYVDPPRGGMVRIAAGAIETLDDRELAEEWIVPASEAATALDAALVRARSWMSAHATPKK